jgi:hypothetical protein
MYTATAETTSHAKPDAVWELWKTENWAKWDHEVEWTRLDGPFAVGSRGVMKPSSGPKMRFTMTEVELRHEFSARSHLPLTRLDFEHELTPLEDGIVRIKHSIRFSGPLAFFFWRVFGRRIAAELPTAVCALAALAEGGDP